MLIVEIFSNITFKMHKNTPLYLMLFTEMQLNIFNEIKCLAKANPSLFVYSKTMILFVFSPA